MKGVVGYIRTSTLKQEVSLGAQEEKIKAICSVKGLDLVEIISDPDEFSGDLERPGMQRVLDMVRRKEISGVVIYRLDRITRSVRDVIELIELFNKNGVALISICESLDTHSAIGIFFVQMIAAIAELERRTIGERTKTALAHIKAQGFPAGSAPYGFTSQPRTAEEKRLKIRKPLIENGDEQQIVSLIKSVREYGGKSFQEVADYINALGHRTRSGGLWQFQTVQRKYEESKKVSTG